MRQLTMPTRIVPWKLIPQAREPSRIHIWTKVVRVLELLISVSSAAVKHLTLLQGPNKFMAGGGPKEMGIKRLMRPH